MTQPTRRIDPDGFPIPPTFDESQSEPSERRTRHVTVVRWILALVGVGLVASVIAKSVGRDYVARWYLERAEEKFNANDIEGALANVDRAVSWLPDAPEVYYLRAHYREKAHDLQGSLDDYNKLVEMSPSFAAAYAGRSVVYQRLERHRDAIDDVSKAIQLRPRNDHTLLNHRAYTRAIAGLELDEALDDIQRAIDMAPVEEAAYLDTRGYIYYLLGRYDEALVDLDRALQLTAAQRREMLGGVQKQRLPEGQFVRRERLLNHHEAVMVYHRGQVHAKLGNEEQAQADLARGEQLGYNPAEGVY